MKVPTDKITIDTSRNFGIGYPCPLSKLDLSNDIGIDKKDNIKIKRKEYIKNDRNKRNSHY